jgi:hypothetical protein
VHFFNMAEHSNGETLGGSTAPGSFLLAAVYVLSEMNVLHASQIVN